jgi:hypothetical protein
MFREAQSAFARHDYAAAAAAFEQSARRAPHPASWLNAAEAWEKREEWARAAEDCDRALALPEIEPALRQEGEARLKAVAIHVATLEVAGGQALVARIDEDPVEPLPVKRRLRPGVHKIVIVDLATGQSTPTTASIEAGQTVAVDAASLVPSSTATTTPTPPSPPASPPTPPPPPRAASSRPGTASWIAWVGGAALAAGAGVFGGITVGDKHDYDAAPTQPRYDAFYRDRAITNVSLAGAVALAATGFVLWAAAPSRARFSGTGAR